MTTPNILRIAVAVLTITTTATFSACGKRKFDNLGATVNPENALYEVYCPTEAAPPPPPIGSTSQPEIPVPEKLPSVQSPIELEVCDALPDGPRFFNRVMPGLIAIADCKSKVVRFKSRDWQVYEGSTIGPDGSFDMRVMYIGRLVADSQGTPNCWARLLGHITGKASCGANPSDARLDFTAIWTFDQTPPELMEPAAPGMADLRNGKHCTIGTANCVFKSSTNLGCGG